MSVYALGSYERLLCFPTGVAWQRGAFFIFFALRCMGLIGAEGSPSTPSHSQVQNTARLHVARSLGPTMAETRNEMFRRALKHHRALKYDSTITHPLLHTL